MCEMVDPSTSRSARMAYTEDIKTKNDREKLKRGYEGQIDGSYQGLKFIMTRVTVQGADQIHRQVSMEE